MTAMMWLEHTNDLKAHEIFPGFRGRFLHSDNMTFVFWEIESGCVLPEHNHPHEQVSHMIEGEFELTINEVSRTLRPGAMAVIPGHARHSGKALTFCRIMDIFCPKREDYDVG